MEAARRPVAMVTGGSRGIGAATAEAFAQRGYDVAITYRNKARRAEGVRAELARFGAATLAVAGDLTRPDDRRRLLAAVAGWRPRLDVLVLNASGGLERDLVAADPDYPTRINRDAQVALVEAAAPLLARGATVVFVTSHWAHLHGRVAQLPAYEPVAASKHAGEAALRARQADLAARAVRLLVVTGDLVEGTITPRLLERAARGLTDRRQATAGPLPTAADMAEAIAGAAADPALPSGHTIVVGGALDSLPLLPVLGAAGVLYHAATDSVLLHHRDAGAPIFADCWHTFGGHSEPEDGGDPVATWRRELREELGVEVAADRVRPLFEDAVAVPGRIVHVFWAEWPERSEDFVLGEGDGYAWYPLEDALALPDLSDRARERLRRLRDRLRSLGPASDEGATVQPPARPAAPASEEADGARHAYGEVTAALREAYDRGAGERERGEVAPWKLAERERFLGALRAAGARTLLEVGAGAGKDALFFRERGLDVTCTDLSPAMVALCRAKGLRAEVREVLHLGLPPDSFDAAYTLNCLLHVPKRDLPAALGAIRAVVRPGGLCFLGVYGGRDAEGVWADDRHQPKRFFSFHTDDALRRAVAPAFELLDFRAVTLGGPGAAGLHFQALLLRRPPAGPANGAG